MIASGSSLKSSSKVGFQAVGNFKNTYLWANLCTMAFRLYALSSENY
jgi:hypothetical protein